MTTTGVSICNSALLMVGSDDINSFEDATIEAKVCKSIYEDTVQLLLQLHPWRFSLKQRDLGGKLSTDPEFKWANRYQLPSDMLRVIAIQGNVDYEIFGDMLYTDAGTAKIVYQARPDEQDMPSYFVRALQFHLASIFTLSLQEDARKAGAFDARADKETVRAKSIDTQQQTASSIPEENFSLLNVRG